MNVPPPDDDDDDMSSIHVAGNASEFSVFTQVWCLGQSRAEMIKNSGPLTRVDHSLHIPIA